jgi:hypothetical protein
VTLPNTMLTSREVDLDVLARSGSYTYYVDSDAAERCASLAHGVYQRACLDGGEAWSGATLKGKAKKWGAKYTASRDALLDRIDATGDLTYLFVRDIRNGSRRHVVIIGRRAHETDDREVSRALAESNLGAWNLRVGGAGVSVYTEAIRIDIVTRGPLMLALRASIDSDGSRPCVAVRPTVREALCGVGVIL